MPDDKPKWVRVYDKQTRALDRYTVVFGDKFPSRRGRYFTLEMNEEPLEDGGYMYAGIYHYDIERAPGKRYRLGKRIKYDDLSPQCKKAVISLYKHLWNLQRF